MNVQEEKNRSDLLRIFERISIFPIMSRKKRGRPKKPVRIVAVSTQERESLLAITPV